MVTGFFLRLLTIRCFFYCFRLSYIVGFLVGSGSCPSVHGAYDVLGICLII